MTDSLHWNDVMVALRQIIHATDLHSKRMARLCGLTIPQAMLLKAIESLGDVTVKRISRNISLSQATVTIILNRLEERGLIERSRNLMDKRVVNARLTEHGRQTLAGTPPLLHDKFIKHFESLEELDKNQLLSALQRIASMMDAETTNTAPALKIRKLMP